MPTIETELHAGARGLKGFSVDICDLSPNCHGRELTVAGWALGLERRAVAVECTSRGDVLGYFPLERRRPDVAAAHLADSEDAGSSGYEGTLRFVTPPAAGLELAVVLADQERVPAATVHVREELVDESSREPTVSIVIPCFQQAHFLQDALASAVRQTYPAIEVVVVDDGSSDNTQELVERCLGAVYVRQRNLGLAAARNAGFKASTGEFVIFLDADDRLVESAVAAGMSCLLAEQNLGMVAGHFRFIGLNGIVLATPEVRAGRSNHYLALIRDYYVGPPGVMLFRRLALERAGEFDPLVSPAADYDMALRVARELPIGVHDEVVLEYRRHGANMSGDSARMLAATETVLKRQWPFVRSTGEGRRAFRAGLRRWREVWGRTSP
jgi:hypothetical protein